MKKNKTYRIGVFETNSSSSHTLILSNYVIEDQYKCRTLTPDENGVIHLTGGEFGWEWERYTTAWFKANYLAVYATMRGDDIVWNRLKKVIMTGTGASDVINDVSLDWSSDNYSCIDHESYDRIDEEIVNDESKMYSFIFDVRSILVTGNDNEYPPCGIKDPAGTIYKYKLEIPSLINQANSKSDMMWYFVDKPSPEELSEILYRMLSKYWYDKDGNIVDDWVDNYSAVINRRLEFMMNIKDKVLSLDTSLNLYSLYKTYIKDGKWECDVDDVIFIPFTIEEGIYELYK